MKSGMFSLLAKQETSKLIKFCSFTNITNITNITPKDILHNIFIIFPDFAQCFTIKFPNGQKGALLPIAVVSASWSWYLFCHLVASEGVLW